MEELETMAKEGSDIEDGTGTSSTTTTGTDMGEQATPLIQDTNVPSASTKSTAASKRVTSSTTSASKQKKTRKVKRLRKKPSTEQQHGPLLKYGSLFLLVAQVVGLVLIMRYSRTHHSANGGDLYLSSTAVFCMEVLKFLTCNVVVFSDSGSSIQAYANEIHTHIWSAPTEVLKVSIPSFLYVVQNNLLYLALSNLDAATYQVCYQLKILTTALFSATMLKRRFSRKKWLALIILTVGVAIVQTSGNTEHKEDTLASGETQNRSLGLIAILCAACTSGFSGVYFEKILKGSSTSLWIRNIQMGLPSVIISFITVFVQDGAIVREKGFFVGYSPIVWTVVVVQAIGGLIVAVVMKYADNVLKTFATSFSIVISCIISSIFFDFHPNMAFLMGASLVVISTVMYSQPDKTKLRRHRKSPVLPLNTSSPAGMKKSALVM